VSEIPPPDEPEVPSLHPTLVNIAPNPFNPGTRITYEVPHPMQVKIAIYDLRGRLIAVPLDLLVTARENEVTWDGCDQRGRPAPAGSYLVRLTTATAADVRKIALVK